MYYTTVFILFSYLFIYYTVVLVMGVVLWTIEMLYFSWKMCLAVIGTVQLKKKLAKIIDCFSSAVYGEIMVLGIMPYTMEGEY